MSKTSNAPRVIAALAVVLSAVLMPCAGRATTIGSPVTAHGYTFVNFDPTLTGNGVGSNVNGISNSGQAVGTIVDVNNASIFSNFSGTPASTTLLNTGANAIAFGINSAGDIVGAQNFAFILPHNGSLQTLPVPAGAVSSSAFGINDQGNIVGQYATATGTTPGFILANAASNSFITINAPSGPNVVFAQGINNNGLVVGFYIGTDGEDHGFTINQANARNNVVTGIPVADPTIPAVPGEPGATFVFAQILGINDSGIAVGYYGDSTGSQHGFFYNIHTGAYSFLDDPAEQFSNAGVEITQITGINNAGQIAGFYTDSAGVAHSFVASSVPEPASMLLAGLGLGALVVKRLRRR